MKFISVLLALLALSTPAFAQRFLIITGMEKTAKGELRPLNAYSDTVEKHLVGAGAAYRKTTDDKLRSSDFNGIAVAILPNNPNLDARACGLLEEFCGKGGKLLAFYTDKPRILALLGIKKVSYLTRKDLKGASFVAFEKAALPGLPASFRQYSVNILEPTPLPGTRLLARWMTNGKDGAADTGIAAATVNSNGVYFCHVLRNQDITPCGRFVMAVLGQHVPELWYLYARKRLKDVHDYGHCTTMAQFRDLIRDTGNPQANALYQQAEKNVKDAQPLLMNPNVGSPLPFIRAADLADDAILTAQHAYLMTRPSRDSELRGAWIHSAYGLGSKGWDETIRILAQGGFNAIFVNMCWGYVADYESKVLPVHPDVATKGDQIALCLQACRKYGVELHVWKVCWNMGHRTPPALVKQMQDANRVQVSLKEGKTLFLAPHIPENLELERQALLEIVKNYDVDGIHLDYIRYPDANCDFSESARDAFQHYIERPIQKWPDDCKQGGAYYKEYLEWRRNNISRLVEAVHKGAKQLKPAIAVSAAVYGDWPSARRWVAQDACKWANSGWLDFICPMLYMQDGDALLSYLKSEQAVLSPTVPIYAGIGSYLLKAPADVQAQIQSVRKLGVDGFICFSLNNTFATETLPLLSLGCTAAPTTTPTPHHSKKLQFTTLGGQKELGGAYRPDTPCTVELSFKGTLFKNSKDLSFFLERDGATCGDVLVQATPVLRGVKATFTPRHPGIYHLCVSSPQQGLFSRSKPINVLSEQEVQQALLLNGPPQFLNNGALRVAVWQHNAFGAKTILDSLRKSDRIDAAPLYHLDLPSLARVQVLVIPQPQYGQEFFQSAETARLLEAFVQRGGGLMVTHALVGIYEFAPLFSKFVQPKAPPINGSQWQLCGKHPIVKGLPPAIQTSTFGDMIGMTLSKQAVPIAVAADGTPVIAAVSQGRGRYVPCGLGLGIAPRDGTTDLTPAEQTLLINIVNWLGRKER